MVELEPPYRAATPEDSLALAELVDIAGEGLPFYLWNKMAEDDETPWDIGQQRAKREEGSFSYRNAIVLEHEKKVIATLIGYPLPDAPEPIDYDDIPAMFVPLQELENQAPGTWYINVLAAYAELRGQGCGTALLALAERIAVSLKKSGLSLIVADANINARRLYERCGYRQTAQRPMVKEDWQNPAENWLLLVKAINPNQQKS